MKLNFELIIFVLSHYFVLTIVLFSAYILGHRFLDSLDLEQGTQKIFFYVSTGLGAITYALFFLMLLKWFYLGSVVALTVLLLSVSLLGGRGKTIFQDVAGTFRSAWSVFKQHWFWQVPVFLFFGYVLLLPLYPPFHHDELTYHLPYAKYYVENHGLVVNPYLRYAVHAHNFQILYSLAILLYDDILTHLIHASGALLTVVGIYCLGRDSADSRTGVLAAIIFSTSSLVMFLVSSAFIDLGLMVYVFLGFFSIYRWSKSGDDKWIYLAGFACGLAIGTKYSGLIYILLFGFWVLFEQKKILPLIKFLVPLIIFGSPWYIRNYVITGDPFFPGGGSLFGYSWYWSAKDTAGQLYDMLDAHGTPRTLNSFLLLPYNLVTRPEFFKGGSLSYFMLPAFLSPLFFKGFSKFYRILTIFVFVNIILWFASTQIIRYLIPTIPLLALLSARTLMSFFCGLRRILKPLHGRTDVIRRIFNTRPQLAIASKTVLLLALVMTIHSGKSERYLSPYPRNMLNQTYPTGRIRNDPIPVSMEDRESFQARRIYGYSFAKTINEQAFRDVYHIGFARLKYLFEGEAYGDYFGPAAYRQVLTRFDNKPELFEYLRSLKIDFLLLEKPKLIKLLSKEQLDNFLEDIRAGVNPHFELFSETDDGVLLRLSREQ